MENNSPIIDSKNDYTSKKRHGCLTAWLVLLILGASFSILSYALWDKFLRDKSPIDIPQTFINILLVLSIVNLVAIILLLKWKKLGFWIIALISVLSIGINIYLGLGVLTSIWGLSGVAILYGILQMKENGISGWDNLE